MSRKILIVSEGAHELGQPPYDKKGSHEPCAALPTLVHRILGTPANTTYVCKPFKDIKHRHGKGDRWYKKALASIEYAKSISCCGLVILIDRDNDSHAQRLVPLEQARNDSGTPCAVGNAIKTFDAWMIADAQAIKTAGGNSEHSHSNPESLDNPKEKAFACFGNQQLVGFYADMANNIDLEQLKQSCRKGFEPFYNQVSNLKLLFD